MEACRLSYEFFWEEGDKFWFSAFDHNGLYCRDNTTQEVNFLGKIPGELEYQFRLYSSIFKVGEKIFLIPHNAISIAVYDIKFEKFSKIFLKEVSCFGKQKIAMEQHKFWKSVLYNKEIIMMPCNYPAMVILNIKTFEIRYITDFVQKLDRLSLIAQPYITDMKIENDIAYCSCGCMNAVIKINLRSHESEIIVVPSKSDGYAGIAKVNDDIWLGPVISGGIIRYNTKTKKIIEYIDYPEDLKYPAVPFQTFFRYGNRLLLVPALANQFILLNIQNGKMEKIEELSRIISKEKDKNVYSYDTATAYFYQDYVLTFVNGADYGIYRYDFEREEIKSFYLYSKRHYPKAENISCLGKYTTLKERVFGEYDSFPQRDYLKCVELSILKSLQDSGQGRKIGKKIYDYTKNI